MKKSIGRRSKIVICTSIVLVLFMSVLISSNFIIGSYVKPQSVYIKLVDIDDSSIKMNGSIVNGFEGFSGYKLIYKNKILYVKLRYSLVSIFNPSGNFEIRESRDFEGILKAYLLGANGETKLIWSK